MFPVIKLLELIEHGENYRVDFKRSIDLNSARGKSELVKDITAIANASHEKGYLIIGVDDDGTMTGTTELAEEQIQQIVQTYITPPLELSYDNCIITKDGSQICIGIISISATIRPHKFARGIERMEANDVYTRHGTVIVKASPEEIIAMHNASRLQIEANTHIRNADIHLQVGNNNSAISALSRAIELSPSDKLFLRRGLLKLRIKDEKSAYEDFSNALKLTNSETIEKQARIERLRLLSGWSTRYNTEDWNQDFSWLQERLTGFELGEIYYLYAYRIRGDHYLKDEGYSDIIKHNIGKAIELSYEHELGYYYRAEVHYHENNYGLALNDTNKSIELYIRKKGYDPEIASPVALKASILARLFLVDELAALLVDYPKLVKGSAFKVVHPWPVSDNVIDEMILRCIVDYDLLLNSKWQDEGIVAESIIKMLGNQASSTIKKHAYFYQVLKDILNKI